MMALALQDALYGHVRMMITTTARRSAIMTDHDMGMTHSSHGYDRCGWSSNGHHSWNVETRSKQQLP